MGVIPCQKGASRKLIHLTANNGYAVVNAIGVDCLEPTAASAARAARMRTSRPASRGELEPSKRPQPRPQQQPTSRPPAAARSTGVEPPNGAHPLAA